jgi:phosphoserine phosphatase
MDEVGEGLGMTGSIKMVVFDLDGVLVDIDSSWQTIHRAFNVDNEENFRKHLRNEIDYSEFMRSDIGLWGNPHAAQLRDIFDRVPLMKGTKDVLDALRKRKLKTAIISSGILMLAERVKDELSIDHVFANRLLTDDEGRLLGEGEESVTLRNKGVVLERLCRAEAVKPVECAVVGDSRFDLSLFEKGGVSIAFNAQDRVILEAADVIIEEKDLRLILPWIIGGRGAKAYVSFRYGTEVAAKVIVGAVSPDNFPVPPGLFIKSSRRKTEAETRVFCAKGAGTLLATLDDLLSSIQLAEKTIRTLESLS